MNYYLQKYSVKPQLLKNQVNSNLGIIVVIPCYNEPNLIASLDSLYDCHLPNCWVEVIVVINSAENADELVREQNKQTIEEASKWKKENSKKGIDFYFIDEPNLPQKDAGVGLARKIGMDEAVIRFEQINKPDGIIICFDADATCEQNYLVEIEKHFKNNPKTPGCSIHFEHPLKGDKYPDYIYKGIEEYELHLRYYKNGLKFCGLPYAFHTIGSSMAVRNSVYQKQNGMNKRKAGEDFYFLQKIIPLGNFTEITTTKVIPSPRMSDRVPFGTGKAMQNYLDNQQKEHLSYSIKSFIDLKQFCEKVPELYISNNVEFPQSVKDYLAEINFKGNLEKIKKNSPTQIHFIKLFFNWFNAFKVLKYMHFARDNYYPDVLVTEAANDLLLLLGYKKQKEQELLVFYREMDRKLN
ncbi:glycosyltransferase family 2 protein [Vicingus serpentipes]|uniref:Glycosyltransferase family 2 protein n=1 Tax=Vicingus serpentipes TaxID=1926625 RepID=A0A5C6RNZ5_9FLAO|nr:glycosyltransferase family A protein [Vicingus serpentipes]TXB63679.1 glycosyltransferase family 2 protein [Vicingus serpentipes]